jgi:conjugative element/phage-associated large polyvalent protein
MAEENRSAGNGQDTSDARAGVPPKAGGDQPPATLPRSPGAAARGPARASSAPREPALNAIQASRRPKRNRTSESPRAAALDGDGAPATGSPAAASTLQHADSDPWTVPQSVRDRFVQDGHRFFFPDGAPAFRDLGRRLTTVSENTQVVHSLIEIARSRGWTEVTVTGTERFRQEAWRQARLEGLRVRGYRPTDLEQAQLVRALARGLSRPADSISSDPEPPAQASQAPREARPPLVDERYVGRLLDHGKDTYRHDPDAEPSYFVRLGIPGGYREIWGKDIERAVAKSLTQPELGDEVILLRTGRDAVTVKRPERDAEGQVRHKDVEVYRNRWVMEKREFFEQRAAAAQVVRDESVAPQAAVRQHPELAGTYLNLRAAGLAAQRLRDPLDQKRFVSQVRTALADAIERGEPLQPVRLRERAERKLVEEPERVR